MTSSRLPNYLLANRKRLALSQEDVAFLLGAERGTKVCRYERFFREPGLRTALACEAIFQRPIKELFAGLYKEIDRQVAVRARALLARLRTGESNPRLERKRQVLRLIAGAETKLAENGDE